MEKSFPALLRRFRERAGLSQNGLAERIGKDPGTVNRLESGKRAPVNKGTVLALSRGLDLSDDETSELLAAAGHLPEAYRRIGPQDADLRLIAEVLGDESLSASERQELRLAIRLAARRFRPVQLQWQPCSEPLVRR